MTRRALAGGAWVAALVATLVALHALGSGSLSAPPVLDRGALRAWLDHRGALAAAFALVRLVGMGLAGYLLAVTGLGLAARLSRVPALIRLADAATVPAVRRVLGAVAGVGLTASTTTLLATDGLPRWGAPEGVGRAGAPVVIERLADRADVVLRRLPAGEDGTATMEVEEEETGGPDAPRRWRTEPGDHLWGVAEAALARAWDRVPTEAEVAPYWAAVVEANRVRLLDPANPDLIHPGQVFHLPPPPPAPPG